MTGLAEWAAARGLDPDQLDAFCAEHLANAPPMTKAQREAHAALLATKRGRPKSREPSRPTNHDSATRSLHHEGV